MCIEIKYVRFLFNMFLCVFINVYMYYLKKIYLKYIIKCKKWLNVLFEFFCILKVVWMIYSKF